MTLTIHCLCLGMGWSEDLTFWEYLHPFSATNVQYSSIHVTAVWRNQLLGACVSNNTAVVCRSVWLVCSDLWHVTCDGCFFFSFRGQNIFRWKSTMSSIILTLIWGAKRNHTNLRNDGCTVTCGLCSHQLAVNLWAANISILSVLLLIIQSVDNQLPNSEHLSIQEWTSQYYVFCS